MYCNGTICLEKLNYYFVALHELVDCIIGNGAKV